MWFAKLGVYKGDILCSVDLPRPPINHPAGPLLGSAPQVTAWGCRMSRGPLCTSHRVSSSTQLVEHPFHNPATLKITHYYAYTMRLLPAPYTVSSDISHIPSVKQWIWRCHHQLMLRSHQSVSQHVGLTGSSCSHNNAVHLAPFSVS